MMPRDLNGRYGKEIRAPAGALVVGSSFVSLLTAQYRQRLSAMSLDSGNENQPA